MSRPASGRFRLRPPRFLQSQRPGGWLLPPRFESLAHSTGAWDSGHSANPLLQTPPKGATTIRLPSCHDPTHPLQAQGQTRLNGQWCFYTSTAVAITHAETEGYTTIPADPKTQEHRFAVIATVLAMPIGRVGRLRALRLVRLRALQGNGRGILMQPGRREGIDLQGCERDGAQDTVEMRGTQRIKARPYPVIVEPGARSPRLQERYHAPLFQASRHLVEGMLPIQNGQHQGFDPTPTRAHMGGVGRAESAALPLP
mgnify:CR=1 FL=1